MPAKKRTRNSIFLAMRFEYEILGKEGGEVDEKYIM